MDTSELVLEVGKDAEYYRKQARETITEVGTVVLPESKALLVSITAAVSRAVRPFVKTALTPQLDASDMS
jgi:hypothetical protein